MKEKTLQFDYDIKLIAGHENVAADALSRYPVSQPAVEYENFANDIVDTDLTLAAVHITNDCVSTTIERVLEASKTDTKYQILLKKVNENSFACNQSQEVDIVKPFYNVRKRLFVVKYMLMYKYENNPARIIIPRSLRSEVIDNLHAANQGVESIQSLPGTQYIGLE